MAKRFIKLYEQITNWEWFRHPNTLSLFIYLLVKAYYKDTRIGGKVIRRGQLVTSLPKIATDTGLSIRQTRTALTHLISTGEVTDESSNQYRIITIVKYDDYQNATDETTGKRQANDRRIDRQKTDESTPYIEYIESIERDRKIESPKGDRGASRFAPPTKEEIKSFCQENSLSIDVDYLFDYYSAQQWKLSNGNKMMDWKAAVRNWARRDEKQKQQGRSQAPIKRVVAQDYTQRPYPTEDDEAMRRMLEMGGML